MEIEIRRLISFFKADHSAKQSPNTLQLACLMGIGDTLIVCSLVKKIKEVHGVSHVTIVTKSSHAGLVRFFASVDDCVVVEEKDRAYWSKFTNFSKTSPFYAHFGNNPLLNLLGYKHILLSDCYRSLFFLPQDAVLVRDVEVQSSYLSQAEQLFSQLKLVKLKTVVLFPEAVSVDPIADSFWDDLVDSFLKRGFKVCLNTKNPFLNRQDVDYVHLPLDLIVPFCNLAGNVIALRSGICDLLALFSASSINHIIYPDVKWWGGKLINSCSLHEIWQCNNNFIEHVFNEGFSSSNILEHYK